MTRSKATTIGFVAVLLWALLALLTVGSAPTPPLLLNAICFSIGGTLGLIWTARTGGLQQLRNLSWKIYAFGSLGLFCTDLDGRAIVLADLFNDGTLDMVVANILLALGMHMMSPTTVSLPFKLLLFVLVDGWNLVIGMLLQSFAPYT